MRLFCSYTVQAPAKKMCVSTSSIREGKKGKKCKGNRLQKHVGGSARWREGGRRERDGDILTEEN